MVGFAQKPMKQSLGAFLPPAAVPRCLPLSRSPAARPFGSTPDLPQKNAPNPLNELIDFACLARSNAGTAEQRGVLLVNKKGLAS